MITPGERVHLSEIMNLIEDSINDMLIRNIDQWDSIYPDQLVIEKDIEESNLYIYQRDDVIGGIIVLNQVRNPGYGNMDWNVKGGKPLVVHRLCIHPDFQKKGVGRELMMFAEAYGRTNRFTSIQLDAFSENKRAIAFYENANYQKVGSIEYRKGLFFIYEKDLS